MFTRKQIAGLLGLLFPAFGLCQPAVNKFFSMTPAYDAGQAILPMPGGGYAIFGYLQPGAGTRFDGFMLRVDAAGNVISQQAYGEPNADERFGQGVIALADGWLAAGSKGAPINAGWVVRLNATGQVVWAKTYANVTRFNQLIELPGGGYLGIGAGAGQMTLVRISADGSVVWQQYYPVPEGFDAYLTSGGNACLVMSRDRVSKVHLGTQQMVWSKKVEFPNLPPGAPEVGRLVDIVPLSKGMFALIGSAYRELPSSLYTAHYAAVWNEQGERVWDRYFRGADRSDYDENEGFCVTFLPNMQNILFIGKTGSNISVTRTTLSGSVLEQREIATPGDVYGVRLIRDGIHYVMTGAVFVGSMNTFFYRSAGNSLSVQADDLSELPTAPPAERWEMQHEPASARAWITALSEGGREAIFRLWALDGSLAREMRLWLTEGENRFPLDLSGLPNGLYWISEASDSTPPRALFLQH